jgi:hypothetical protein
MGAFGDRVKSEVASRHLPVLIEITQADRLESKEQDPGAQMSWLIGEARLACSGIRRVQVVRDGDDRLRIMSYAPNEAQLD